MIRSSAQEDSGPPGSLPHDTVEAVQAALGAEHAAIWVYGLVSAFLPNDLSRAVADGMTAHRARRDATARLLATAGLSPNPAEAAYMPPKPVDGRDSAIAVLVTAESDLTVAWRAVLDRSDDPDLRRSALDALTSAAVRATRWRKTAGTTPVATALPGQP